MRASLGRSTTIFTKRPRAGRVKTRLCPPLAPRDAARLAQAMLDDVVASHQAQGAYRTALAVAPAGSVRWFERRYPGISEVFAQRGVGLSERLAHRFEAALAEARTAVVIGSDCPLLLPSTVEAAHSALEGGADLVLAPDGGGGYCLVGLARACAALFCEVPMSRASTFTDTLAIAEREGLMLELLPEHYDVDTGAELVRLSRDLSGRGDRSPAPRTGALLGELGF